MIIDDDQDLVVAFRAMLELNGYQVDTFTNPQEALDNLTPKGYDVIITDIKMPTLTGLELVPRINEIDKDTRIMVMTAFDITRQEFEKVLPFGRIDAFIRKPIGMVKLMDHLRVLLGTNHRKDDHRSLSSSIILS
jgi:DNA-binding NtrC family response regulator